MYRASLVVSGFILSFITASFVCNASAMEVTCLSGGKQVYKGDGKDFRYEDGILTFIDKKTKMRVFTDADCIVLVPEPHKHHKKPHHKK